MNKNLVLFISFFLVFSLSVSGCLKEENDNENNININDETKTEGNIWIMDIDGSNKTQLTFDSYVQSYPSISLDGKSIIFWAYYNNNPSIWTMTLDGKDQKNF